MKNSGMIKFSEEKLVLARYHKTERERNIRFVLEFPRLRNNLDLPLP